MGPSHAIVLNPRLHGFEYGALRDFEAEIVRLTGARAVVPDERRFPAWIRKRIGHGMRYGTLRPLLPKANLRFRSDVTWIVLMGPETFDLDLYKGWIDGSGFRILYLMDTFPAQIPALRRVLRAARWDLAVTSFRCAVPMLETATQRKWHSVPQGISPARFAPPPEAGRVIEFSAYGRRVPAVHKHLLRQSIEAGTHYDFSACARLADNVSVESAYRQYAWHLGRSAFTFCWPVEVTSPERAAMLSPVTCRWFEAAASGTVVLGKPPRDPDFVELFGPDAVIGVDPAITSEELAQLVSDLTRRRASLREAAMARRSDRIERWSWQSRVRSIMELVDT